MVHIQYTFDLMSRSALMESIL